RFAVEETARRFRQAGDLTWPEGVREEQVIDDLVREITPDFGPWLARNPSLEDVTRLSREVARGLADREALADPVGALAVKEALLPGLASQAAEALGAERKTFA